MLAIFSGVELLLKLPIIFYARLSIITDVSECAFGSLYLSSMKIEGGRGVFYLKEVDSSSTDADKLRIFLIQFFHMFLLYLVFC